jgi:NAD(P)-dependent dehydrogenase (short-subunit alcohol dehydrogenase family)
VVEREKDEMAERLAGRVGVITGGASGIGLATARRFVDEGARLVLGDRNEVMLAAVAEELGDAVATEVVDVTSEADVERLVARALGTFGGIDLAVNCAGLGSFAPIIDHPLEEWRTVIDVCLTGVFLSVKHEAQAMRAAGTAGAIVNIASINAKVPAVGLGAYCSAKAGVEMLTRNAGMELGPLGIRVAGIGPGFVETPLTEFAQQIPAIHEAYIESIPLGRPGAAGDIASAALFLVSDEASWVSGETLYVDGAESTRGYPDFTKLGELSGPPSA